MENLFNEILSMSIDAVWLIGAVIIVRALLYKAPKYFYKILWGLVGLRLIIPFSFKSELSLVPEQIPETVDRVATQVTAAPAEQRLLFMEVVAVVWMTIGLAFFVYGIISYAKLKRRIFDSVIYKENIYYSERIKSPFVCGFVKPKIYIPYGLDEETEKCVLQHEKMHIKHGDHILKYLGFVVLCIHWFNPLVWVSYFLLCKDIELSCDESVIKKLNEVQCKQYAKALLDLGVGKVKLSACPIAFGEVSIKTRIKSVVNYKKTSKFLVLASLCLCIGVSVCFMTEPEVSLKEKAEEVVVSEKTTEPTTEMVTEPETEVATEPVTEAITEFVEEVVTEIYEPVEDTPDNYEEMAEEFEIQQSEMVEYMDRYSERLLEEANKNNQSNLGSNSSVIGTKPSYTPDLPTMTLFPDDPTPTHNYGNTNSPHFEGNQWVYN